MTVALVDWLQALPDAQAMRDTDRWATETLGIPSLDLMERAGLGLARAVEERAGSGRVVVVCGTGNNGGDGSVAARLLREWGQEVDVLLVGDAERVSGDARINLERLGTAGTTPFTVARLEGAAVIVDALLGTGAAGAPRSPLAQVISAINDSHVPVISADVPSGVDASTGEIAGVAVWAEATVTFAQSKPGLHINPGKGHAGAVRTVDIGIPAGAPVEPTIGLLHDAALLATLPGRDASSTKFASGFVLVAGGSIGMTGAPCLVALGAMRAGAGYVTACVPASQQPIVAAHLLEVMTRALTEADGAHVPAGAATVLELAQRGGSLVVGPGLGRSVGALAFARTLTIEGPTPLVLDADGLAAFAGEPEALSGRVASTVLTPHEGELGRLLGVPSAQIKAERLASVSEAARRAGAVVVLKGDDSLIARPDGLVAVSPGATPALATAGTGDVLSGVIAALLAQGVKPFTAACAGVRLHARAGLLAAAAVGSPGVIASDVIAQLPAARRE